MMLPFSCLTTTTPTSPFPAARQRHLPPAAMDLLPPPTDAPDAGGPGAGGSGRGLRRGVGFRSLKLVSVAMDETLPVDPVGATYGRLANGLTYYVRSNPKPRMRAALSLAVKVGSVLLLSPRL